MIDGANDRHMVRRDTHPIITLFWTAESVERGRPVILYTMSCMFCGRPMVSDFRGAITQIINAPANLAEFGQAFGTICKVCKQRYRFVVVESFLGSIDVSEAINM